MEVGAMAALSDWRSFWDGEHSIYVNARHKDVHYRDMAAAIVSYLPGGQARVLDFGCGEATHADDVAAAAAEVLLCEAAASVRASMAARFVGNARIKICAPEELEGRPSGSLDLIVANSVVQYLSTAELERLLALWKRLLAPGGTLIVADIIPPDVGALSDVVALLRYAAQHGFLLAALAGLVRTAVSPYRKLRNQLGIAQYTEAEFMQRLRAAGYTAERLAHNMEHNPARMTFRARPA
jgi:SAM-dependent methyltransferase